MNEADIERVLLNQSFGFIRQDPMRFVRLSFSRVKEYFKFWPTQDSGLLSNIVRMLSFGLLLPFLVAGTLLALFRRGVYGGSDARSAAFFILLMALLYSGLHFVTWTLVRYRLPVDAMLMPFAALGLVFLYDLMRNPRARTAFRPLT
jgi:hypothetical protein